jgi:UDP-N-acetyl-D-mannosaminuronic acid dehydrogenase
MAMSSKYIEGNNHMINVIGLGYIGLPTALILASHGVEVVGTDYNKDLVDTLNAGKTTFKENGLDELFQDALKAGIRFSTEYQTTDIYIVSVPDILKTTQRI